MFRVNSGIFMNGVSAENLFTSRFSFKLDTSPNEFRVWGVGLDPQRL